VEAATATDVATVGTAVATTTAVAAGTGVLLNETAKKVGKGETSTANPAPRSSGGGPNPKGDPPSVVVVKKRSGPSKKAMRDQPWNIRPGQEWKQKIIGKAQKTGTPGHAKESYKAAIREAKDPQMEKIYLNRGIRRVTKDASVEATFTRNRRPDVTAVKKDGKIQQVEVQSKTDDAADLTARMQQVQARLPAKNHTKNYLVKYNKETGRYEWR
jgi:hypothetical protein